MARYLSAGTLLLLILVEGCEGPSTYVVLENDSSRKIVVCRTGSNRCETLMKDQSTNWYNPHVPFEPSDLKDVYVALCGRKYWIPELSFITMKKGSHDYRIVLDENTATRFCAPSGAPASQ